MLMNLQTFWRKLLATTLLVVAPLAMAQRQAPEAELKAAILANMLLFVDWPSHGLQAADKLTLCYLDTGPVSTALGKFEGRLIKSKPLQVVRIDISAVGGCHALYLSPLDAANLPRQFPNFPNVGILMIGDSPGYLQRGAMINLDIEGGRVVFDIDLRSVRRSGLVMSSKVLRLARQVLE